MRNAVKLSLLAACLLRAQEPQVSGAAERAARLMTEAAKLADQRTGKAMEQAIGDYRQATALWRELGTDRQPRSGYGQDALFGFIGLHLNALGQRTRIPVHLLKEGGQVESEARPDVLRRRR